MKPLHIEFTGRRSRRMAALGGVLAVVLVLSAVGLFLHGKQRQARLDESRRVLEQRLDALTSKPAPAEAPPMPAWFDEADLSLKQDWNELMSLLERIEFPGVRLLSLQAGVLPDNVRVDYQLDSWHRVAEMTEALNEHESSRRWILQSIAASALPGASDQGKVRATWERMSRP